MPYTCDGLLTALHVRRVYSLSLSSSGVALNIYPGRHEAAPMEVVNLLASHGGDLSHIAMTHLEITVPTDTKLLELARRGCYLNHSFFGKECSHVMYNKSLDMPSDAQRIRRVKLLVDSGFEDQVLISHDIVLRHELVRYGGYGYAHIMEHIVPKMVDRGIEGDTVMKIVTVNPQRWLTFAQ